MYFTTHHTPHTTHHTPHTTHWPFSLGSLFFLAAKPPTPHQALLSLLCSVYACPVSSSLPASSLPPPFSHTTHHTPHTTHHTPQYFKKFAVKASSKVHYCLGTSATHPNSQHNGIGPVVLNRLHHSKRVCGGGVWWVCGGCVVAAVYLQFHPEGLLQTSLLFRHFRHTP